MSETETSPVREKGPNSRTSEDEKKAKIVDLLITDLRAGRDPLEDKAYELGLTKVWVYHCGRCNYVWLPKDFDIIGNRKLFNPEQKRFGEDLIFREPPKACARCKSRYWNRFYRRNTKDRHELPEMWGAPRVRAMHRQGKLDFAIPYCRCQYCKAKK